jgi:hypothetical protein
MRKDVHVMSLRNIALLQRTIRCCIPDNITLHSFYYLYLQLSHKLLCLGGVDI